VGACVEYRECKHTETTRGPNSRGRREVAAVDRDTPHRVAQPALARVAEVGVDQLILVLWRELAPVDGRSLGERAAKPGKLLEVLRAVHRDGCIGQRAAALAQREGWLLLEQRESLAGACGLRPPHLDPDGQGYPEEREHDFPRLVNPRSDDSSFSLHNETVILY